MNIIRTGIQLPPTAAIAQIPIGYNNSGCIFPFGLAGASVVTTPLGEKTAKELWREVGITINDREIIVGKISITQEVTPVNVDTPIYLLNLPLRADLHNSGLIQRWKPIFEIGLDKGNPRLLASLNEVPASTPIALPAGCIISGEITLNSELFRSSRIDLGEIALNQSDYSFTLKDLLNNDIPATNNDFEFVLPDETNIGSNDPDHPNSPITLKLSLTPEYIRWECRTPDGQMLSKNSARRNNYQSIELVLTAIGNEINELGDLRFIDSIVQTAHIQYIQEVDEPAEKVIGARIIIRDDAEADLSMRSVFLISIRITKLQLSSVALLDFRQSSPIDENSRTSLSGLKLYDLNQATLKQHIKYQGDWIPCADQQFTVDDKSDASRLIIIVPSLSAATQKTSALFNYPQGVRTYLQKVWSKQYYKHYSFEAKDGIFNNRIVQRNEIMKLSHENVYTTGQIIVNSLPTGLAATWDLGNNTQQPLIACYSDSQVPQVMILGLALTSEAVKFVVIPNEIELQADDDESYTVSYQQVALELD